MVSTHSRPKAAGNDCPLFADSTIVSTHSRPKAAGFGAVDSSLPECCFNTQPPEGGWNYKIFATLSELMFQHTAARRRLGPSITSCRHYTRFNTQPPEGGWQAWQTPVCIIRRFNTQPPEGGWTVFCFFNNAKTVSTHSRPKAAGASLKSLAPSGFVAPISLSPQEKREREYNTAFSVIPAFAIS